MDEQASSAPTAPLPQEAEQTRRAQIGFWLGLSYLLVLAQILPHGGASDRISEFYLANDWLPGLLLLIWAVIILEALHGVLYAPDSFKQAGLRCLLICLIPPLRMAIATSWPADRIWLPKINWRQCDQDFFTELEFRFTVPMLIVTLLILPVMAVELFMVKQVQESLLLALSLHHITAFIWAAFATEFIILVSVSRKKLDYCKQNWINIVIIILPLIGFLRSLRLFRMVKIAKAGKLARAYRLRGLLVRAQRLAILFNLIERLLYRKPEKHLAALREREQKKLDELAELQEKIRELEKIIAEQQSVD